jgi:hypothetical protein
MTFNKQLELRRQNLIKALGFKKLGRGSYHKTFTNVALAAEAPRHLYIQPQKVMYYLYDDEPYATVAFATNSGRVVAVLDLDKERIINNLTMVFWAKVATTLSEVKLHEAISLLDSGVEVWALDENLCFEKVGGSFPRKVDPDVGRLRYYIKKITKK